MENTTQTNLLDTFQRIESYLPQFARTGIFSPGAVDYLQGKRSLHRPRAEVLARKQETADTVTFSLRPPAGYPRFKPGQYIDVAVEIRGVRHVRQYSITSGIAQNDLAITVKLQDSGLVSGHLHAHTQAGQALEISVPKGEFVLPAGGAKEYHFCSAGSGITPVYAMVRALLSSGGNAPIHFYHAARSRDAVIFAAELEHLADRHENFFPHFFLNEAEGAEKRRLNAGGLTPLLSQDADVAGSAVFICGPGEFVQDLESFYSSKGFTRIATEYYTLPKVAAGTEAGSVEFVRSSKTAQGTGNLLELAEQAGLKPKHGCRRGICHECKAHKKSGMVKNILSGQLTQGEENIQLCVSQAVGRVEVEI